MFIRVNALLSIVILTSVSGCLSPDHPPGDQAASEASSRTFLNSERIQQQFGSYGIDVLEEGDAVRVSNLYSIEGNSKVTRSIAVVIYPSSIPADILPAHHEVKGGGSIGEVFARRGWDISKQNLYFGELPVSEKWSGVYSLMGCIAPASLAVHVYEFLVSRGGEQIRYATITEVHHPKYLGKANLAGIYGAEYATHRFQNDAVRSILRTVGEEVLRAVPEVPKAARPRFGVCAETGR